MSAATRGRAAGPYVRSCSIGVCFVLQACSAVDPTCANGFEATRKGTPTAVALLTACIDSSITQRKDRAQALEYRAWLQYEKGDFSAAAQDQGASFALTGAPTYHALINQTLYLRRAGNAEESLKSAKLAEEFEKRSGQTTSMMTQYHIGWSLLELGKYREAISAFTTGIPYQPDFSAVYWLRSQAYERLGEHKAAREDLEVLARLLESPRGRELLGGWSEEATIKLNSLGIRAR